MRKKVVELKFLEQRQTYKRPNLEGKLGEGFIVFPKTDYSLFKKGIQPMWEDSANKQGGRWLINLDKKQRSADLDKYWLEIVS